MSRSPIAIGSAKYSRSASAIPTKQSFKQRLRNWLFDESSEIKASHYYEETINHTNFDGGMNFTIHKASGGLVVNVHFYDSTRDRSQSNLYVIQDDDNIGENLTKILTMENLKR